ncbi:MAG: ParA family protein [Planctomycetota bacterium]
MHTLALVNQKGGCGKTTSAVHLAGALVTQRQRVLLVDLDPQAHATMALGCAVEDEPSMADVLLDGVPIEEALQTAPGGVSLAPATARLAEFEEIGVVRIRPEAHLRRALLTVRPKFDFVILDCPPRVDGLLAANAVRAADTVVLVIECGTFALQGALQAVLILDELAEGLEDGFRLRALATLFERDSRLDRDILIAMQARFDALLFDTVVSTSMRLREAAAAATLVQLLDPGSRAASDFDHLATEVRGLVGRSTRQPTRQSTSQSVSRPAGRPASQPASQAASQAASRPANQPASRTAGWGDSRRSDVVANEPDRHRASNPVYR